MSIFNIFIYQPILNLTVFLYNLIPGQDLGIVIICLTIFIEALLFPLNIKSIKSQKTLSELEPKIKEIKEKFKNNKEQLAKETMKIYQNAGINPLSGIFSLIIQIPILFGLYKVFSKGIFNGEAGILYSFISSPSVIKTYFLGINLSQPNFLLTVLAVVSQFFQTKLSFIKKKDPIKLVKNKNMPDISEIMRKQMLYFFPFFTFLILLKISSAISLYLVVSSVFTILQTLYITQKSKVKS